MTQTIEKEFEEMGARAEVSVVDVRRVRRKGDLARIPRVERIRVDVRPDRKGKCEYFEIVHRSDVDVRVLDIRRQDRHLLLVAREAAWLRDDEQQSKFLCGYDERAWFVAAIPEDAPAESVQDAKDALKPEAVWESIRDYDLPMHQRDQRWTKAFVRQGEWFFIPRPQAPVELERVLVNEPIRRGAGKPHVCQFLYRTGGEPVYVSTLHPNGLTVREFQNLDPVLRRSHQWTRMVRAAGVYVKGSIRHADHATIWLPFWHEVVMNRESEARAMRNVAFLN